MILAHFFAGVHAMGFWTSWSAGSSHHTSKSTSEFERGTIEGGVGIKMSPSQSPVSFPELAQHVSASDCCVSCDAVDGGSVVFCDGSVIARSSFPARKVFFVGSLKIILRQIPGNLRDSSIYGSDDRRPALVGPIQGMHLLQEKESCTSSFSFFLFSPFFFFFLLSQFHCIRRYRFALLHPSIETRRCVMSIGMYIHMYVRTSYVGRSSTDSCCREVPSLNYITTLRSAEKGMRRATTHICTEYEVCTLHTHANAAN
jgi:hypothetical protein